jgi:HEPN domain-containing protein
LDRQTFKRLALLRLVEAKALLDGGHHHGAYYLCGYAVECALKACLAKQAKRHVFPPRPNEVRDYYWTHDLNKLLSRIGAPLTSTLKNDKNWAVVKDWAEDNRRYSTDTTPELARQIYGAVADKKNGVLRCIRKHW